MTRKTTIIAALGLPGAAMCLWIAFGAAHDAYALRKASAASDAASAAIADSDVPAAARALPEAGERAAGPCDGAGAAHAWTRALRRAETDALAARLREHFRATDTLTIADFKTLTELTRKQTIPLLEHFDKLRLTLRAANGSDRLRGPNA